MSNSDSLLESIKSFLTSIGISDIAFTEYFHQIIVDEEIEQDEKIEIITEFLQDSNEEDFDTDKVQTFVLQCIVSANALPETAALVDIQTNDTNANTQTLTPTTHSDTASTRFEVTRDQIRQKPAIMSRKEREERELLLSRYGYETEEIVERNGEEEISFKSKDKVAEVQHVSNKDLVRKKEAEKRLIQKQKHQDEVLRNRENLEKQRLAKEAKKKGSVKQERKSRG